MPVTWVLGVDLGGTVIKAGLADEKGTLVSAVTLPAAEAEGRDAWLAAGRRAMAMAVASAPDRPVAIGLAVPGAVDPVGRVLVDLVARLATEGGVQLAQEFALNGLPVAADNDARAALAAERRWGAAVGIDDVVMFTLGTGLGGAAVVGGKSPAGDPVLGGIQLGHTTVELGGGLCVCGNRGCAELLASASGVVRMARQAGMQISEARAVFATESTVADAVTARFVAGFGAAVVNAIHSHQPSVVVVAGGLVGSASRWLPAVQDYVDRHAWTSPGRRVPILESTLGGEAGILAGSAVAFRDVVETRGLRS